MKNKFILWLSLLIAFNVTFHSCRTDLEAGQHNEEKLGEHIHQKISTETFQKETFLSGVNEFKSLNKPLSGKGNASSDYLKRFSIDETSIYKMDVNNTETYALRAYNIFESPETVYNLVYRKKGNNVAFSIIKILENELIPVYDSEKGIVTKIDNPSTSRICTDFYSVEIWHCKEGVSWSQCDKCDQCLFTSSGYTSYECGGGGGGSNGGGGSTPGGGDTGGGGGGTGLYDPSGYTFDPNIPPTIEPSYVRAARASSFFYSQTDQAKSWAVEHVDIYCNILEYYLDHIPPTSPPPNSYYQDFANFAIQFLIEHPEVSWEEFESIYINNPCNKIKDWFNNSKFKEKFDKLTKVNPNVFELDRELAAYMRYPTVGTNLPPSFVDIDLPSCATDGSLPNFEEGMGGLMHTHNNLSCSGGTPIKIPSPTDIQTFINVLMREAMQYTSSYQNAYSLIATSGANYMLMYNGTNYPGSISYEIWKQLQTDYERDYNKLYEENENVTQANIEKIFTKFIKEKVNKLGLEVYRVTPTSKTKIEYDPNSPNSVKQTPCP